MRRLVYLFMAALLPSARGASLDEIVASALPRSDGFVHIFYARVAVCPDDAVWLFWTQAAFRNQMDSLDKPMSTDKDHAGIFCRLVGRDGRDVIAPRRVVEFNETSSYGFYFQGNFMPVATPDGGVLLFHDANPPNAREEWRLPGKYNITIMDRRGQMKMTSLDVDLGVGTPFWSLPDRWGDIRCILGGWGPSPGKYLTLRKGRDAAYHAASVQDIDYRVTTNGRRARSYLRWTRNSNRLSAVALIGDTLLVAVATSDREHRYTTDTLTFYRLNVRDLDLVDSTLVPRAAMTISGEDFVGKFVPRAVLQKTVDGYRFFLASQVGTISYRLDVHGRPAPGKRKMGVVQPDPGFSGMGTQLVDVSLVDGNRRVDWFGFAESGELFGESTATRAAVEGKR